MSAWDTSGVEAASLSNYPDEGMYVAKLSSMGQAVSRLGNPYINVHIEIVGGYDEQTGAMTNTPYRGNKGLKLHFSSSAAAQPYNITKLISMGHPRQQWVSPMLDQALHQFVSRSPMVIIEVVKKETDNGRFTEVNDFNLRPYQPKKPQRQQQQQQQYQQPQPRQQGYQQPQQQQYQQPQQQGGYQQNNDDIPF